MNVENSRRDVPRRVYFNTRSIRTDVSNVKTLFCAKTRALETRSYLGGTIIYERFQRAFMNWRLAPDEEFLDEMMIFCE